MTKSELEKVHNLYAAAILARDHIARQHLRPGGVRIRLVNLLSAAVSEVGALLPEGVAVRIPEASTGRFEPDWQAPRPHLAILFEGKWGLYVTRTGDVLSRPKCLPVSVLVDDRRYNYPETDPVVMHEALSLVEKWHAWLANQPSAARP